MASAVISYPVVYVNSKLPPAMGSLVELTYANSVASTGVLHGEATRANVSPAKYACILVWRQQGVLAGDDAAFHKRFS